MEENFDKKLSSKIKEVIEESNVPYNPKHWEMLLKKKKKKRSYLLLWRYAAALLLLLSLGSLSKFFFTQSNLGEPTEQQIIIGNRNDSLKKEILKGNEKTFIVNEDVDGSNETSSRTSRVDSISNKTIQTATTHKALVISNDNFFAGNNNGSIENKIENDRNDLASEKETIVKNKTDINSNDSPFLGKDIVAENKLEKDSLKDINELIASNTEDKTAIEKNRSRTIKIGVNISSEINYNQEVASSNLGFGGGVSIDFPISKKLDLYSGILYNNQKLNMIDYEMVYESKPGLISSNNPQQTSEKAILKGIEVPVNLKYNFSINNKKVFVSGGVSSTYYFEENIESGFVVSSRTETITQDSFGNDIVQYKLVQSKEEVVTSNSNNFNFANILNLSMGIELPLKKQQQSIVLEPYFKYSIRPVTQENIDFSSAGIFLRYNFNFYRK